MSAAAQLLPTAAVLSLLAALAACAAPACAQERHDLARRATWRAEDVATRTSVSTARLVMLGSRPGDPQALDLRRYSSTRAVTVEKCLEVDREGNRVSLHAYIRDWIERRGDADTAIVDTLLQGTSVLVTGHGRDRGWKFLGDAPELSPGARQWLESHFGVRRPMAAMLEMMLPKHRVAVAESWDVDPAPLLERITQYPVTGATGRGTLRSVENGVARVHFDFAVSSRGMPFGEKGEVLPWKKGGTMRVTLEASVDLEGARGVTIGHFRSNIDGEITSRLPDGVMDITLENSWAQQQTIVEGGELPPLPRAQRQAPMAAFDGVAD